MEASHHIVNIPKHLYTFTFNKQELKLVRDLLAAGRKNKIAADEELAFEISLMAAIDEQIAVVETPIPMNNMLCPPLQPSTHQYGFDKHGHLNNGQIAPPRPYEPILTTK